MSIRRAALVAVISAIGLVGCGSETAEQSKPGPFFTYPAADPNSEFDSALFEGELVMSDGCLLITRTEAGQTSKHALAFSAGSVSWDPETQVLTNRDETFALGDSVSAGGGEGSADSDLGAPSPAGVCDGEDVWNVAPYGLTPGPPLPEDVP